MWIAGSADDWVTWLHQGGDLCAALKKINPTLCNENVVPGTLHGLALRDAQPDLEAQSYSWAMHQISAWK